MFVCSFKSGESQNQGATNRERDIPEKNSRLARKALVVFKMDVR